MNVPPASAAGLDLVSLGALIHRLDPGIIPFRKATECRIHVSGGEFNVAANLADCFRLRTGIASAMVDYPIGDLIAERVRAMGVRPFYKRFAHDGATGPNMATVYSDQGHGVRAPVVFYNRSNEAAARLKPGDFNWKEIFAGGVRFHSGGIFAALSARRRRSLSKACRRPRRLARSSRSISTSVRSCGRCSAAATAPSRPSAGSSPTSTCWSATKKTCRKVSD
jgi:2-dehydro-3-deoxygluconokinase